MRSLFTALCTCIFICLSSAATIKYDWHVSWITANPDGLQPRPVIAINGNWPSPALRGMVNDTLEVTVHNELGNQSLSMHWHGIHMTGNNKDDGVPMVTQCPIIPGASYTYFIQLRQPGTYWYHSHSPSQYVDGLRGPLIVDDPHSPYTAKCDAELVMTVSDWYHEQGATLQQYYLSLPGNPNALEPIPVSALMSDQERPTFPVEANKTYYLRIINMSGFAQFYFHIDGHNMSIIEADGVYSVAQPVEDLYIATGQRYGVLLKTKPTADRNFAILGAMDLKGFPGSAPPPPHPNVTGALIYNRHLPFPSTPSVETFTTFDDFCLVPFDQIPLLGPPDQQIVLNLSTFSQLVPGNEQNRAGFNNITFIPQKVPSLYTALSGHQYALNPIVYGNHSNPFVLKPVVLKKGEVVEIVVYNYDTGIHPIHLHGHTVQLVGRTNSTCNNSPIPMRRDTWMEPRWNSSDTNHPSTTIRFQADNPGVWFFHCHMEWHLVAGMDVIFVEDPLAIQNAQPNIPTSMEEICKKQNIPLKGNAAGNYPDFLNLTGEVDIAPMECGAAYPPCVDES
ncbi:hypothetical protein N7481_011960 [Penicillium waksmanii]|uniref:uncharacterized protein n=1 Tax=Penicillium waksmanii TaxID=69791 RepID=UPI002548C8BD|nr:uncharacterized protein N7481_011960 [Penicillium waksmanii]KAJ5965246.1 hypothetical protein N7481_011960 [Penicillium waksmanii]